MERTRGSRTVAPFLFALVLLALVKGVLTDPGKKRIMYYVYLIIRSSEDERVYIHIIVSHIIMSIRKMSACRSESLLYVP